MLMYGNSRNIIDTGYVFNITGLVEGYWRLPALVPPADFSVRFADLEFDKAYAQYIMNNDAVFVQFFMIVFGLYQGMDVYLIMDTDEEWSENVVESLLKLIQQRYGYNAYRIDSYEDYNFAYANNNSEFDVSYGIANLDMDKERYTYLTTVSTIKSGGTIIPDE